MTNPYYSYYSSYINAYQSYETYDPYYYYTQTSAPADTTTSESSSSTAETPLTSSYPTSTYDAVTITTSDSPSTSTLPSSSTSSETPSSTTASSTIASSTVASSTTASPTIASSSPSHTPSTAVPFATQTTPRVTLKTSASSTVAVGTATAGAAAALATPSNVSHHHSGISGGAIAAAVIVPLIALALGLLGLLFFFRRRRNAASRSSSFGDVGGAGGVMSEKDEGHNPFSSSGGYWQDAAPVAVAAAIPAPTRQQMIDFDARGQMLQTPAAAELAASRSVESLGAAYGRDSQRAGAASRMSTKSRPSMSTIRTTASTVMPHPPVLPPVDTSFNFSRSVGTEASNSGIPTAPMITPQSHWDAAVAAGAVGGIAGAAGLLRRDNSNSANSTTSSHRDPFATPSPSSAHTRSSSSVLTRSESDVSRAGRRYEDAERPNVPAFSFSQSSPTLPPAYSAPPQEPARPSAKIAAAAVAPSNHVTRPSLAPANRTNTNSSFNPSEFSGTDNETDTLDDAEIVEPGAVVEAIMVRRAQVGERTRASVVEVPVGHSRQGSRGTVTGRKGSGGSEGSGIGRAQ